MKTYRVITEDRNWKLSEFTVEAKNKRDARKTVYEGLSKKELERTVKKWTSVIECKICPF